jgi:hypothetical protein
VFVREVILVLATPTFSRLLHPVRKFIIFMISHSCIVGLSFAAHNDWLYDNMSEKYIITTPPTPNIKTHVQGCI